MLVQNNQGWSTYRPIPVPNTHGFNNNILRQRSCHQYRSATFHCSLGQYLAHEHCNFPIDIQARTVYRRGKRTRICCSKARLRSGSCKHSFITALSSTATSAWTLSPSTMAVLMSCKWRSRHSAYRTSSTSLVITGAKSGPAAVDVGDETSECCIDAGISVEAEEEVELLAAYQAGDLGLVLQIWFNLSRRTDVCIKRSETYHAVMVAVLEQNQHPTVIDLMDEMKKRQIVPSLESYNMAISSCSKLRNHRKLIELISDMRKIHKCIPKLTVYVVAMEAYAALGMVQAAEDLLAEVKSKRKQLMLNKEDTLSRIQSNILYMNNIFLNACKEENLVEKTLLCLQQMKQEEEDNGGDGGVEVDTVSYNTAICTLQNAPTRETASLLKTLFEEMRRDNIPLDHVTYCSAISIYAKLAMTDEALVLFRQMQFVQPHGSDGLTDHQGSSQHDTGGGGGGGESLFVKQEIPPPPPLSSSSSSSAAAAAPSITPAIQPNLACYNAILNACARGKRAEEAIRLLTEMEIAGGDVAPTVVSYGSALMACAGQGMTQKALELFDVMLGTAQQQCGLQEQTKTRTKMGSASRRPRGGGGGPGDGGRGRGGNGGGRGDSGSHGKIGASLSSSMSVQSSNVIILPEAVVIACTSAIWAASKAQHHSTVIPLLQRIIAYDNVFPADAKLWDTAVCALAKAKQPALAIRMMKKLLNYGFKPQPPAFCLAMECCAATGDAACARWLLADGWVPQLQPPPSPRRHRSIGDLSDHVTTTTTESTGDGQFVEKRGTKRRFKESERVSDRRAVSGGETRGNSDCDVAAPGQYPPEKYYRCFIKACLKAGQLDQALEFFGMNKADGMYSSSSSHGSHDGQPSGSGGNKMLQLDSQPSGSAGATGGARGSTGMRDGTSKGGNNGRGGGGGGGGGMGQAKVTVIADRKQPPYKPSLATINALLDACAKSGQSYTALDVLDTMERFGPQPDVKSYGTVITAFARARNNPGNTKGGVGRQHEGALSIFQRMKEVGVLPNRVAYNTCIDACAKAGALHEALALLEEMKQGGGDIAPDQVSYCSAIACAAKAWQPETALQLLREFQVRSSSSGDGYDDGNGRGSSSGSERLRFSPPNAKCYTAVIDAFARAGQYEDALRLLDEMERLGVTPDIIAYNSAMNACSKARQLAALMSLFTRARRANIALDEISYNMAVNTAYKARHVELVLELLRQMRAEGLTPGPRPLNDALKACQMANRQKEAQEIEQEMRERGWGGMLPH